VVAAARDRGLGQVVVGQFTKTRRELAAAGWRVQILGDSQDAQWVLATARGDSAPQNRCS
jgi:N-acyl-L-homoserine lactone synthetase